MSHGREYQTENVPFGGLAHAGDDTVQCVLATLLQSLSNGLRALFVRSVLEEARDEMVHGHLTMLFRPVL